MVAVTRELMGHSLRDGKAAYDQRVAFVPYFVFAYAFDSMELAGPGD